MNNFYLYFNWFTLINLFILFAILFFRKNNSITNKILALIVINPGLNFIDNILIQSGYIYKVPFFLFIFQGTAQFYAPLVYAYVVLMMGQKFRWFSILNIITLLVILLDVYYGIEFYNMSDEEKYLYLKGLSSKDNYPFQMNVINGVFVVVMLAYFIVSIVKILRYCNIAKDYYSDIEKIKIRYLKNFVILLIVLNISMTMAYLFSPTESVEYFYIPFFINITYVYIIYYAFRHSAILTETEYCTIVSDNKLLEGFINMQEPLCKEVKEIKKSEGRKYKLTEIEMENNYRKIKEYFEKEKPYLDSSINLTKLSSLLNECSHNISLTINVKFNMTFFDLINYYRIEEAKKMLKDIDKKNYTIEAVIFDCGFNTKSAFYRAFKKHVGMTPSEYLLSLK